MRKIILFIFLFLCTYVFAEVNQIEENLENSNDIKITLTNRTTFQYLIDSEDGESYTEYFPFYNYDSISVNTPNDWNFEILCNWNFYTSRNYDNSGDSVFGFNGLGLGIGKYLKLKNSNKLSISGSFNYFFDNNESAISNYFSISENPTIEMSFSYINIIDPLVNYICIYSQYLFPSTQNFSDDQLIFGISSDNAFLLNDVSAMKFSLDLNYSLWNNSEQNLPSGGFSATLSCSILAIINQDNNMQIEAGYNSSLSNPFTTGKFFTTTKSDISVE